MTTSASKCYKWCKICFDISNASDVYLPLRLSQHLEPEMKIQYLKSVSRDFRRLNEGTGDVCPGCLMTWQMTVHVQRELVEGLWWESWTPAVTSIQPRTTSSKLLSHTQRLGPHNHKHYLQIQLNSVYVKHGNFFRIVAALTRYMLHLHVVLSQYMYLCI